MTNRRSAQHFDYLIVGAGAAGCVLADRLSADPDRTVLLVEAGGTDRHPIHLVPKGFYFTLGKPRYAKGFTTEPFGNGAQETYRRGRVIGGSTTINGMVWNRGWAPDFDAWAAAGNPGWDWTAFLAAYRALERHQLGGDHLRGAAGAVDISVAGPAEPACDALLASMAAVGVPTVADMNGSGDERGAYVASNVRRGLRMSAARAYLRPALRRPNLTVATDTEAEQILFDGVRAVGLHCRRGGDMVTFTAGREILVAGGAFDSPLLLERSGVGPRAVLAAAGVPVVVDSPRVGANFSEHRGIQFQYRLTGVRGYNPLASSRPRYLWTGFRYLLRRDGMMAHGGYAVSGVYRSDPRAERPDTQTFFTPISTSSVNPMSGRLVVDREPGARLVTFPIRPTSRGCLHITGPGLDDRPRLEPNFLSTEHDRELLPKVVRRAREIVASQPFATFVAEELEPGPGLVDDEAIVSYGIDHGVAGAHALGTCAIGPDEADVVDNALRVRGTTGLRVVDASVFPGQPSGNNNAPTMALAWIAAERIRTEAER